MIKKIRRKTRCTCDLFECK